MSAHHQTTITQQNRHNSRQNRNLPKGPSPFVPHSFHNWGRKLALDWRYWAKNKAERSPNLVAARRISQATTTDGSDDDRWKQTTDPGSGASVPYR